MDDISSADNAHQFAIMQDRDALDVTFEEEHRNLAHRSLFTHGDDIVAHNISNAQPLPVDLANNIGLCDNADDLAIRIDDRRAALVFTNYNRARSGDRMRSLSIAYQGRLTHWSSFSSKALVVSQVKSSSIWWASFLL